MIHINKRKGTGGKKSELPHDYLRMVEGVLSTHFADTLAKIQKDLPETRFHAWGAVFPDEILLSVTLLTPDKLHATTVTASCDYDPKASSPTAEDLLAICLDASGGVWDLLTNTPALKGAELLNASLGTLGEEVAELPLDWAQTMVEKRKVWILVDKTNPLMESMTEDWLAKNDPQYSEPAKEEQKETEKLFVTGKNPKKPAFH